MFPEGTRSFDGRLQKGEAGVGLFLAKTGAPVLPIRLIGTYEAFPRHANFFGQLRLPSSSDSNISPILPRVQSTAETFIKAWLMKSCSVSVD